MGGKARGGPPKTDGVLWPYILKLPPARGRMICRNPARGCVFKQRYFITRSLQKIFLAGNIQARCFS